VEGVVLARKAVGRREGRKRKDGRDGGRERRAANERRRWISRLFSREVSGRGRAMIVAHPCHRRRVNESTGVVDEVVSNERRGKNGGCEKGG
jgi:hypothetical protein